MKKVTGRLYSFLLFICLGFAMVFCTSIVHAEDEKDDTVNNGIPVVYLNIDETQGKIEDMNASTDHSVYCYGTISIDVPEGFHYSDFEDLVCEGFEDMAMSIRGRGNSSWSARKKPYKIKLDKKTDVFGLGKNKHWVLLANAKDSTLLRDRITAWLGDEMGFDFTPRGVPVDVVMTGQYFGTQYLGSYYLSENVRVDDNRLEIAELEEGDTDPDIITGGYLIQNALQVRAGSPDRFYTARGVDWATNTPSFDLEESSLSSEDGEESFAHAELGDGYENHAQQEYIQQYIRDFEDILFEDGLAYRDLMDIESAAKYWLVQEVSLNSDAFATGSTYIYKDRDSGGSTAKLYWGPLWDFDYAWNFKPFTDGLNCGHYWMNPLFYDTGEGGFVQEVHKDWIQMKGLLEKLIEEGGVIDKYYEETKASAEYEWEKLHSDPEFDYLAEVEDLKNWIRTRIDWVDANISMIDSMSHKVTYVAQGEVYKTDFLEDGWTITGNEDYPNIDGYTFMGWMDEGGNIIENDIRVDRDLTITAKYVDNSEMTHVEDIALVKDNEINKYVSYFHSYTIPYTIIPEDAEDQRVYWTSSDPYWAKVNDQGVISYNGAGKATFTATLKSGITRQFTFEITDQQPPVAASIFPLEEEIHMTVGDQKPFIISTDPMPAKIYEYSYVSDDTDVVTVGENGLLTAVGPGEAKVHISAVAYGEDGDIPLETYTTVIVTEKINVDNGIPVIYLDIDEDQGTIEAMLESMKHDVYCYGTISIDVPEGFHYADFADLACESLERMEMSIRGRGNSTWENSNKKPFKIKLDKKTDIFGLGKNKHWVLIANEYDPSLLRDRITGWLGDEMEFDFTPRGVPVDLVMRGKYYGEQYLGSYYFSENVRVDDNRLEIAELEEGDTDPQTITGGYLIQNGNQLDKNSPDRFRTKRKAEWATHTPSFDTEGDNLSQDGDDEGEEPFFGAELEDAYKNDAQQEYIQNYVQMFEDVLFEGTTAYRDLMDIDSAAKYWLVQAFTLNGDAYITGSTYFYKDRDGDDGVAKIFWGPLWDFDYGYNKQKTTAGLKYCHEWIKPMLYDRAEGGFVEALHTLWPQMREKLITLVEDGGIIDQYRDETRQSANQDIQIYHPDKDNDYDESVEQLKNWIKERIAWMDENFDMIDDWVHKVTYIADDEVCWIDFKANTEYIEGEQEHPEKEGYVFLGWADEEGNIIDGPTYVTEDLTLTAKYISEEDATRPTDIAFSKDNDIIKYNSHVHLYQIEYTIIPQDAMIQEVSWSSSDESWATIDEYGLITFNGPGTAVFTATLDNGKTRQFTLTVTEDSELPVPESIYPDEEEIHLFVGEQSPFSISTEPTPAKIQEYIYESEDESVVTVGKNGVLTAVGPGTAKVRVKTITYGPDGEEIILETYTTVIVSEEEITYSVTADSPKTWKKGSKETLTITVKRSKDDETCYSHFTGVQIDDVLLEKDKDYTAKAGSTVITIKAEKLETLSKGNHTVKAVFDDGEAVTQVEILAADDGGSVTPPPSGKPDSPDTGDRGLTLWYVLTAGGLLVFALAAGLKKRFS